MMLTVFITQARQNLYNYFRLPATSITTCLAFKRLRIYYSISLCLPSQAHLSSSASLFSLLKRATIYCSHRIRPESASRLHPNRQCKVPVPATVPVPGSSVRLPFLLRQASAPATTSQSSPPRTRPISSTAKYRYLQLAAPAPSPRAVASLGYSLERSPTPPQIAASQGPGPLTSATPSGAPAHSSTHEPVSQNANTPLDAHMLQAINFPASASRLPGSPPPTFASKRRHLAANLDLATLQMPSAISFRREDAGRRLAKQSALAKLVMNNQLFASPPSPPSTSPSSTSPTSPELEQHHQLAVLPPPTKDVYGPLQAPIPSMANAVRIMNDLTDTPPYSRSVTSTAPSSPRIPPQRQNSGSQTPRVRPHATTLNIPGMTRSKVSPDGRIPQRDVAAKLVIVMVGLPARGKSYITKKLQRYLTWQQHESRIFNVGNRRRKTAGRKVSIHPKLAPEPDCLDPPVQAAEILLNGFPAPSDGLSPRGRGEPTEFDLNHAIEEQKEADQSAQFFDPKNEKAAAMREQVAMDTLDELLDYLLNEGGAVGILDATNSTIARRQHVVDHIKQREPKLGILFIESICHDKDLLEANMRLKLSGPDYRDRDPIKSLEDFKARVAAYASAYQPLGDYEEEHDMQYIQMVDVGRKLIQHRLKGFLSGGLSTYLSSFNLAPRQIWITRHGQSLDNELGRLGGDSPLTERGHYYAQALHRFITQKRKEWIIEQKSKMAQATFPPLPGDNTPPYPDMYSDVDDKNFCVWTSMLQRSVETAEYFDVDDDYDVKNWEMLNELNSGQFEGMTYDEIAQKFPEEFKKRAKDKLNYIYPGVGGEGYLQVISRLRDMVREIERITDHVLIIGHRSVCRVLMAYFMDLTREDITDMDVPLGMLYSIEPKPYGIAFHAYKYNDSRGWFEELPNYRPQKAARGSV